MTHTEERGGVEARAQAIVEACDHVFYLSDQDYRHYMDAAACASCIAAALAAAPPSGLTPPREAALRLVSLLGPDQTSDWKDHAYDLILAALSFAATAEYSAEEISRLASIRERLARLQASRYECRECGSGAGDGWLTYPCADHRNVAEDVAWLLARLDAQRESTARAAAEEPERAAPPRPEPWR